MQLQFSFFFACAVTVSKFSELFIYAATVFFVPELILHKYSVEGYLWHESHNEFGAKLQ